MSFRRPFSLLLFLLLLVPVAASGQAADVEPFRFNDIPWTATADEVESSLTGLGFTRSAASSDDDLGFSGGRLLGHEALLVARMYQGHVSKIAIYLEVEPIAGIFREFDDIVEMLEGKYGEPTGSVEVYEAPYEKGDGHAVAALLVGKAHVMAFWQRPTTVLGVRLIDEGAIKLSYEGPDWSEALAARKKAAADAF